MNPCHTIFLFISTNLETVIWKNLYRTCDTLPCQYNAFDLPCLPPSPLLLSPGNKYTQKASTPIDEHCGLLIIKLALWYPQNKKEPSKHKTPGDTHMHVPFCMWHVLTADDALEPLQQRQKRGTGALGRPLIVSFLCPTVPQLKQQQDGRQHLAEKKGYLLSNKNKLVFAITHQN